MTQPQVADVKYKMTEIYVAVALAIFAILITFLLSRRRKSVNTVALLGLSDAGKTAIFTKIIFNKLKTTVTSLKENDATSSDLNLRMIDIPGADRLRDRVWDQYKSKVNHILFIVDSTCIDNKLRDCSEYLYSILSDPNTHKNNTQFTIVSHKQDLDGAQSVDALREMIETELTSIKATKTGQLGKTSNEEVEDYLSRFGKEPVNLNSLGVNFIETSVHNLEQLIKIIL